ncbi:hemophore-related protein [Mycobacterium simiae]|uniref:Hemophore-related protein n=1 Tax=Mycobacterium simiae TaxID=1784 RepID=A0A5B1BQU3_MYCSI|nr:hemophore-related protein [Mycobacterium simiae]KAA1250786.1 hemophore-related protein [Mycobacterium simiae]
MRLSLKGLSVAVGALALSLSAGAGIASADPIDTVINTTCNYGQVMAALTATDPAAAAQFNASPIAQGWLHSFLAAAPPRRAQMAAQVQAMPGAAQYVGLVESVAASCNSY